MRLQIRISSLSFHFRTGIWREYVSCVPFHRRALQVFIVVLFETRCLRPLSVAAVVGVMMWLNVEPTCCQSVVVFHPAFSSCAMCRCSARGPYGPANVPAGDGMLRQVRGYHTPCCWSAFTPAEHGQYGTGHSIAYFFPISRSKVPYFTPTKIIFGNKGWYLVSTAPTRTSSNQPEPGDGS